MLDGKKVLVTGVRNKRSVAYWIVEEILAQGGEVALTSIEVDRTLRTVDRLSTAPPVWYLDVTEPDSISATKDKVESLWGSFDGVVHSIAHADRECINPDFFKADKDQVFEGFDISSFSLVTLAKEFAPLMNQGGSIVSLTFDTSQIWPPYGWMNFFKVALEYLTKMVAIRLGEEEIRANAISAGTMRTLSARGIPGFSEMADKYEKAAPLEWDSNSSQQFVADVCAWLLSDESEKITGEVIHVDGGANIKASVGFED